ncbi:hypothetical protein [Bifidobacterium cuniculi]|uniref:Uncharacterized protein n=1 Tax=Bifidobacterium cuniculi TaxID=1688 RepID=A0A087B401_9BIFI|nr:hypothetical protein [Bifidobacterium cuniculi]KFI65751.1 hypothetical protein BCUN_0246 [Bifidobacterium cuniculi]
MEYEDDYMDRFIGKEGELRQITDPAAIAHAHERTGFVSLTDEEWEYVRRRGRELMEQHVAFNSRDLREEYARLKAKS